MSYILYRGRIFSYARNELLPSMTKNIDAAYLMNHSYKQVNITIVHLKQQQKNTSRCVSKLNCLLSGLSTATKWSSYRASRTSQNHSTNRFNKNSNLFNILCINSNCSKSYTMGESKELNKLYQSKFDFQIRHLHLRSCFEFKQVYKTYELYFHH